jgi:hypothetical protein
LGILTVISPSYDISAAETSFQCALHAMRGTALRAIDATVRNEWSLAASVARQSGPASTIASDPKTGSWLAVVGTCFHRSGKGDPQYLLSQYLSVGLEELVQSLEGFFTIAIGDGSSKEVVLITDLIGSCHFYVRSLPGGAALSSSSHVLSGLGPVTLDATGCQEFLGMGIIYEERTIHNEIRKLPPATVIKFRNGIEVNRQAYWNPCALRPCSIADEDAVDGTWQALVSAASRIGQRYDRLACDLTGGYDSRAMVAGFLGAGIRPATVVSGNEKSADVVISRGLADRLALPHLHMTRQDAISAEELRNSVWLTDGEGDAVEYASTAAIHGELSKKFQISVNGSFGEVARAYWWELLAPHTGSCRPVDSHMLAARRYAWNSSDDLFQPQFRMNLIDHMSAVVDRSTTELSGFPNTFQMDIAYLRMRMHRWQGRIASSTDKIWPCVSPFMFRSVLETMLQSGAAVRRRSLLVRRMLAKYQPAMADYPLEHGYPATPATLGNLPRFWPIVSYYRGRVVNKLKSKWKPDKPASPWENIRLKLWQLEEIRDLLDVKSMQSVSVLEPSAVTALLKASQQPNFAREAEWNRLLTLELSLALRSSLQPHAVST